VASAIKRKAADAVKVKPIAPETSTFADLGIDPWLVETLQAMQIKKPTEIQRACIGPILAGKPTTLSMIAF
jgi:ATP-dependent RNA helicase DDX49/DBP8